MGLWERQMRSKMPMLALTLLALAWGAAAPPVHAADARHRWGGTVISPSPDPPTVRVASTAGGPSTGTPLGSGGPLSNPNDVTRWANPTRTAPVFAAPDASSRFVGRLHRETEDGFPEVYMLLRWHFDRYGHAWVKVALPGRPNGKSGWTRRESLGRYHSVGLTLVIDRGRLRATLLRAHRRLWHAPVGVGKPSTPTPAGVFWIRERFSVSGQTLYGPFAFGTSAYSVLSDWPGGGVVGIHGTNAPELIPGRPSHGCIRLRNGDISWLARHVPVGTPVIIR